MRRSFRMTHHSTNRTTKTAAAIYRRAARLIVNSKNPLLVSCWAIDVAASGGNQRDAEADRPPPHIVTPSSYRTHYDDLFRPGTPCAIRWGDYWGDTPEESNRCRALGLCFMAAMVEAGDA